VAKGARKAKTCSMDSACFFGRVVISVAVLVTKSWKIKEWLVGEGLGLCTRYE